MLLSLRRKAGSFLCLIIFSKTFSVNRLKVLVLVLVLVLLYRLRQKLIVKNR